MGKPISVHISLNSCPIPTYHLILILKQSCSDADTANKAHTPRPPSLCVKTHSKVAAVFALWCPTFLPKLT